MNKKLLYIFIPLALAVLVLSFIAFYKGTSSSVSTFVTSTKLLNKPLPTVKLANLYKWNQMIALNDLTTLPKPNSPIGNWFLINLWASWCDLCVQEHPFLMDLSQAGVTIYGLNFQDKAKAAKEMLATQGNPYAITFWDARGIGSTALGVFTVPETYLVDPNGVIRYSLVDPLTKEKWEKIFMPIITGNVSAE